MPKIYDLSVSLRAENMETSEVALTRTTHEEAARIFAKRHNVRVSDLPYGSFFATERIVLRSHLGTHLDAPYHFYPTSEGRPAKFIDEWPLEMCLGDAVVLDFRHKKPSEPITEYDLAGALEKISYRPRPGDIVILHTGGTDRYDTDPRFHESAAGMIGGALNYMFRFGVKVMATDSATIDMPIPIMTERFVKGDKAAYFPIHRAGRLTEWTHAEKLAHLDSLPRPFGFKVMFFPVKIARATGAWIRAVAIEDEWLSGRSLQLVDLSLPIMNHSFEPEESRIMTVDHDVNQRAKAKRLRMPVPEIIHLGATDVVDTYTHAGTHIDAPYHFAPRHNGRSALTADKLPLEWFYGDGVLLDFSAKTPRDTITRADVAGALDRMGYRPKRDDIVLIRTGAAAHFADDPNFPELSVPLAKEAFVWLLDQGIRVIGCDAETLDGPVLPMVEALRKGAKENFYPIHYAGREREFCLISKMDLSRLAQARGFKIVAFPIKLEGLSGAWTRAVALLEQAEEGEAG
ncbi:MAG TPA: cyclase family protein [Candidatus Acidoferrales bacterium]|nr:cyclase family protein [Candidatus Acidoferrales bacterium]